MKEIRLLRGSHAAPFDEDGAATMCAEEFVAYLAGEPHSDKPRCVSPILGAFTVVFNDELDEEPRQRLKPYLARQIGTAEDGQDEARSLVALDWLVRAYEPILLEGAGLPEWADTLRGLSVVESGSPDLLALNCAVRGAREAARGVVEREYPRRGDPSALSRVAAAEAAIRMNASDPAGKAVWAAVRRERWARTLLYALGIDGDPPWGWVWSPVAEMTQEGAFGLLDRLIDPGGLHDVSERPQEAREICRRSPERAALSVGAGA